MCGFAGMLLPQPLPDAASKEWLPSMAATLAPRGPDDQAEWGDSQAGIGLTFRRLAVQDLSLAGRQPMVSRSGRWVVAFNGEIYNHLELRRELPAPWRGHSDTETLLAAIEKWGILATLTRLNGMFALALWDRSDRRLTLVRDRLGIKPLYFARWKGGVAFGSELKALRVLPQLGDQLDLDAIAAYMRFLYIPAPHTPYKDVMKLLPGHYLQIDDLALGAESVPWWNLREIVESGRNSRGSLGPLEDAREAVDELEVALERSVQQRMLSDVPVGVLLSGGVDSTLVTSMMTRVSAGPVRTFTVAFEAEEYDEGPVAQAIANYLGTEHVDLTVTDEDARQTLTELGTVFDEPFANPSHIPTYLVSTLARRSVTVALSGDGGDELFGGYNRYISGPGAVQMLSRIPWPLRTAVSFGLSAVPVNLASILLGIRSSGPPRLLDEKLRKLARMARGGTPGEMYHTLLTVRDDPSRFFVPNAPPTSTVRCGSGTLQSLELDDLLMWDQLTYLPDDLLFKVDRSSMAVGLEVRVPLLDHRIVEFSWALPDSMKIRGSTGKWILRKLLSRMVPADLLSQPKVGFTVPIAEWLRGGLRSWAEEMLLDSSSDQDPLLDRTAVEREWNEFQRTDRRNGGLDIWSLIQLQAWRQCHGDLRGPLTK